MLSMLLFDADSTRATCHVAGMSGRRRCLDYHNITTKIAAGESLKRTAEGRWQWLVPLTAR